MRQVMVLLMLALGLLVSCTKEECVQPREIELCAGCTPKKTQEIDSIIKVKH